MNEGPFRDESKLCGFCQQPVGSLAVVILTGADFITEEDAEKLAELRYTKQFWLNLDERYRESLKRLENKPT